MIDPTLSGAGVLITDTVAEANAKVSAYVGSQPYLNRVAQIGAAGRAPKDDPDGIKPISGFASSDVEVSVRGFINDFITNKGKLGVITDTQKQELLNSIKIEYSPNEITDFDAVKRILGMIEPRPFSEFLGTELFSRPNVQSPQQSFPTSVQPTTQQTGSLQDWLDNPGAGMSLLAPIFN